MIESRFKDPKELEKKYKMSKLRGNKDNYFLWHKTSNLSSDRRIQYSTTNKYGSVHVDFQQDREPLPKLPLKVPIFHVSCKFPIFSVTSTQVTSNTLKKY